MFFLYYPDESRIQTWTDNSTTSNISNTNFWIFFSVKTVFRSVLSEDGGPVSRTRVASNRKPEKYPDTLIRNWESVTFHKFKAELTMNKSELLMLLLLLLYLVGLSLSLPLSISFLSPFSGSLLFTFSSGRKKKKTWDRQKKRGGTRGAKQKILFFLSRDETETNCRLSPER